MTRDQLEQLQLERLQSTLHQVARHVAFYGRTFREHGFDPDRFVSLKDLQRLPPTTETDLISAYPYGMFCRPLKDIIRIHTTTGRGNDPIVLGSTEGDLKSGAEMLARIMTSYGLDGDDVFQITLNYGLGTGAFAFHDAARELGASTIPTSVGKSERQIKVMRDFGTSCLVATPGYAQVLLETAGRMGVTASSLRLKALLLTGEPWPETLRTRLEEGFQAKVYDIYGLSAVFGPGIAAQCPHCDRLHIQEDLFLAEILDPVSNRSVPPGRWGELVLTTLTREAAPVLRYKTGDRARIFPDPCPDGHIFRCLDRIPGRVDDILIVKGINIAPERIHSLLQESLDMDVSWKAEVVGFGADQNLVLFIGINEKLFFDRMKQQRALVDNLRRNFSQWLGVTPQVRLVEPGSIAAQTAASSATSGA
jgi:phenylacetate-CoA ligase